MQVPATSGPRNRIQGRQSETNTRYGGGFGSGSGRRRSSPETRKRVSPEPEPRGGRYTSLSSLIADPEIRQAASLQGLLQGRSVRDGGWSVRELLCVQLGRADDAEKATRDTEGRLRVVEDQLAASERNVDAWREHSERGGRGYSGAEGTRRQSIEIPNIMF